MPKAAAGLGALVVSAAMAMAPAIAQSKPSAAVGVNAARSAPSSGFAKAQSRKAQSHTANHNTQGHKAAPKQASGRGKGSHAKKAHPHPVQAKVRPKTDDASRPRPALQFHGGAAGLFTGWPFTRPGSPGRFGGDRAKHQYGGFIGWFGPVFWPYAYDDMFAYVFWPLDSFDYGEAFWAFAYDDLFEGIFWADVELETEPGNVIATAEPDIPSFGDRSRAGVLGLEGQSREFAQICGDRTPGLSQWPILRIAQSVGLTREQRTALKDLQTAAAEAARALKSACPVETPKTPAARLDAMQERVQAMLRAIDLVRPALEKFYAPLSDAQKARFHATGSQTSGGDEAVGSASGENELVPQICTDHPGGLSVQTVDRLENVVRPTAAQRGALDELRTAAARAAQVLRDACPVGTPGSPPERLAAMQQRLDAMLDAAGVVRPALQNFYASLTDAQKARFNAVGKQVGRVGD
jgi:LTXXQ motif family protein